MRISVAKVCEARHSFAGEVSKCDSIELPKELAKGYRLSAKSRGKEMVLILTPVSEAERKEVRLFLARLKAHSRAAEICQERQESQGK